MSILAICRHARTSRRVCRHLIGLMRHCLPSTVRNKTIKFRLITNSSRCRNSSTPFLKSLVVIRFNKDAHMTLHRQTKCWRSWKRIQTRKSIWMHLTCPHHTSARSRTCPSRAVTTMRIQITCLAAVAHFWAIICRRQIILAQPKTNSIYHYRIAQKSRNIRSNREE